MKYLRLLPLCLSVLALPLLMTGCKPAGDESTTATDTNAAPAAADTNAAAPAPAAADTNAPAATTNAPAGT
jgi:hypothetical protein